MTGNIHVTTAAAVRVAFALALASLMAGCGASREDDAAAACEAAARTRSQGKLFSVDVKALAASVKDEGGGIFRLQAPATFDTGLQSEYVQTLDCRVRVAGGSAEVVGITFVF